MLDSVVVMGITVAVIELVKSYMKKVKRRKLILPFVILAVGAGISVLNSGVWGNGWDVQAIKQAAKDGINLSVFYAGIYAMGKAATQTPEAAQAKVTAQVANAVKQPVNTTAETTDEAAANTATPPEV